MTATDLMQIIAGLGLIGLGVAGLYAFGRDRAADEHDLTDHREQAVWDSWYSAVDDEPEELEMPARPEQPVPWRPPYAELTVAQVMRRYGDSPADIAARWLREAGEQARAKLELAR